MDNRQYREALIKSMVRSYRDIRRIDKKLHSKKFQRVYKDASCPSYKQVAQDTVELMDARRAAMSELMASFSQLPEIRHIDEQMEIGIGAMTFAAKCATEPKGRRFMKNQRAFAT